MCDVAAEAVNTQESNFMLISLWSYYVEYPEGYIGDCELTEHYVEYPEG